MPWYYAVVEAHHELQNPTSPEKIELLGERMRLGADSHVLDLAAGKAGPALVLAAAFGCRVTCVERAAEFHESARERVRGAGLERLIDHVHADARDFEVAPERYDAVMCLGASFVWGGLAPTLAALVPGARPGGFVAVGEPFRQTSDEPEYSEYGTLADVVGAFEDAGLKPASLIPSSLDDWDRYESLHWLAAAEWLEQHPADPDADEIRRRATADRNDYLRRQRRALGWAIVVGRKPKRP